MNTKLTLKLDKGIVEKAKKYAKKNNSSISKLVENYFRNILKSKNVEKFQPTILVKEMSGILKNIDDIDSKAERAEYILKKHKL